MLVALCRCGKNLIGSDAMAGEAAQCPKCGRMNVFGTRRAADPSDPATLVVAPSEGKVTIAETKPPPPEPVVPEAPRLPCETMYWILLLALLPLVSILSVEKESGFRPRLEKVLRDNPELKSRIERLHSQDASVEDLFDLFPGRKLDDQAYLPRDSQEHWFYANYAGWAFFIFIGVIMAWRVTPALWLLGAAAFTATFGIAFLLLIQDFLGPAYLLTLDAQDNFLTQLLGFTFLVGLGEELSKALPVIFFVSWFRSATWRAACLWGMASGVGFGIAEGVLYSIQQYHGFAPASMYFVRFASCVTLHAIWSASVGITIFFSRRLVGKVVACLTHGGSLSTAELVVPLLRVLGVSMALHGLYDTLLTQEMILPALVVAVLSFAWLGWQIEESRELEQMHARALARLGLLSPSEPEPAKKSEPAQVEAVTPVPEPVLAPASEPAALMG